MKTAGGLGQLPAPPLREGRLSGMQTCVGKVYIGMGDAWYWHVIWLLITFAFSWSSMVLGASDDNQVPVLTETKKSNGRYKEWPSQGKKKGKSLAV